MSKPVTSLNLQVLFDNPDSGNREAGWGLSFLLNGTVLLDTAENGDFLMEGMRHFGVDLGDIEHVVISHDHWDHTGGLSTFLKQHPSPTGLTLWLPASGSSDLLTMGESLGSEVRLCREPEQVVPGFSVTGEMMGTWCGRPLAEQALVVEGENSFAMFTACAHPGVELMLESAIRMTGGKRPWLMAGGFHQKDRDPGVVAEMCRWMDARGVQWVAPTHCTGLDAIAVFREVFGNHCLSLGRLAERTFELE